MAHACWLLLWLLRNDPSNHSSLAIHVPHTQQHSCISASKPALLTDTVCASSTQSTYRPASAYYGGSTNGLVTASCGHVVCIQGAAGELRRNSCSWDARVGESQGRGQDAGLSGTFLPPLPFCFPNCLRPCFHAFHFPIPPKLSMHMCLVRPHACVELAIARLQLNTHPAPSDS